MENLEFQRQVAGVSFTLLFMIAVYYTFIFPKKDVHKLIWKESLAIITSLICMSGVVLFIQHFESLEYVFLSIPLFLLTCMVLFKNGVLMLHKLITTKE
jgi:hypothetical protein